MKTKKEYLERADEWLKCCLPVGSDASYCEACARVAEAFIKMAKVAPHEQ